MKKKLFAELVESIREAGKIHRGEHAASRSTFLDFAGDKGPFKEGETASLDDKTPSKEGQTAAGTRSGI
jgi:hypothetical protein